MRLYGENIDNSVSQNIFNLRLMAVTYMCDQNSKPVLLQSKVCLLGLTALTHGLYTSIYSCNLLNVFFSELD